MDGTAISCAPSAWDRLRWAWKGLPRRIADWLARMLLRAVVGLVGDSNLMAHARMELPKAGDDEMQALMNRQLLQLVAVFTTHGHSGFSASYAVSVLEKLLRFEPLGPLTGADDEWIDHGDCMQNKRCSHVFKQPDRFGGQAYDIYGRVFREPSGSCYTSGDSHVPITFPYTPKREFVDVPKEPT